MCEQIFAAQPRLGVIAPWVLARGLDAGPCPLLLDRTLLQTLPAGAVLRPGLREADAESSTLLQQNWLAITYPGPPMHRVPPPVRAPARRYSGMALIANQTTGFALRWFFAAPAGEKLRWLARIAARPQRLLQWIGYRIRRLAAAGKRLP